MNDILLATAIATITILALSSLVLMARHWLVPDGTATVRINARRTLDVALGEKLIWSLAGNGIVLPAACGGRGACGQCRVTIDSGAEPLLPSERTHISRRDAAEGVRLACVTTVRHDLSLRLPDSALDAQRLTCAVRSNRNVTTFLKQLVLTLTDDVQFEYRAGDYITLEAPPGRNDFSDFDIEAPYDATWREQGLLELSAERRETETRAYSIASAPHETGLLSLIVRIATPPAKARRRTPPGQVSSYIFGLHKGDRVAVSGPFGDFHARDSGAEMVLIGGGAGIAPLRAIVVDELVGKHTQRQISLWYGARNVSEICLKAEFDALAARCPNFRWHVALSDPDVGPRWTGSRGLIHTVVYDQYLARHPTPEAAEYLICGPPLMASAVIAMLEDLGVDESNIIIDDFGG